MVGFCFEITYAQDNRDPCNGFLKIDPKKNLNKKNKSAQAFDL